MGNYPCALQQPDRVLSVYERTLPAEHPDRIMAMGYKANSLRDLCRIDESLALFEAALKLGRQVLKEDSADLLFLENGMALTLGGLGLYKEEAEVYPRVIRAYERSPLFGPSHADTWKSRSNLGRALIIQGKFSEAIPLLRDTLAAFDGMGLGREHPLLGTIPQFYGKALLGAGRAAEAGPMFQRSIAFYEHKFGFHHYLIPDNLISLAEAYKQLGRGFGERIALLDRAVAICELSIGRDKEKYAELLAAALEASASCFEEAGRLGEAEALWAKCVAANTKARRGFEFPAVGFLTCPL